MELKDRIASFVTYSGKNLSELSRYVGFKTPQALRELIAGNTKTLSDAALQKITTAYPEINRVWLLTGEGEMLNQNTEESLVDTGQSDISIPTSDSDDWVPLLPVEAMAGSLQGFAEGVELSLCRKVKAPVKGADWAIQISGDSMEPDYKNGSYLFIKRMTGTFIPWGHTMVVDTYDGVVVKDIYPVEGNDDVIEARSINPKYPPFRIDKSIVIGIYRVLGGTFVNSTI